MLHGGMTGDIQGEGRLAHGGSPGDDHQVAGLKTCREFVQLLEAGGNSDDGTFSIMQLFDLLEGIV